MGKRICQSLSLLDAIKDLLNFMLAVCDVENASELVCPATFREEKCTPSDTINLYECRQLLLDVVTHAQASADSTDYICSVMYNLYNGLREHLTWLIAVGLSVPCQMCCIQILSVLGLWASAIPPPAGMNLGQNCDGAAGCSALWTRAELQQGWRERGAQKRR